MGNNQKKPFQNVQLFIQVSKNVYESGQTIQGKIHLDTKSQKLPYQKLKIGFYCRQTVLHKASQQTQCAYQTNQKITLTAEQVLHDFSNHQFPKGQYCFSFSIKLPQNLPSSFSICQKDDKNHEDPCKIQIRYALKVQLMNSIAAVQQYGDLIKFHYLNIVRPYKKDIQPIHVKRNQFGKSCLCFGDFTTHVTIYVDKNFVFSGDKLQINGQVDNMHGGRDLEGFSCQLIQKNIVTDEKKQFYKQTQRGVFHLLKNFYVRKGNVQNFGFSYKIPDYLQHSHSIGNHSALIYILKFQYRFKDGCDANRLIQIPLHIQTKTPKLQINIDQIPSSYEWNPQEQALIDIKTQTQFIYNQEYPLGKYRLQMQSNKIEGHSFQYFNKMNEGYPTKNSLPKSRNQSQLNIQSKIQKQDSTKINNNNQTGKQINCNDPQNAP